MPCGLFVGYRGLGGRRSFGNRWITSGRKSGMMVVITVSKGKESIDF